MSTSAAIVICTW